MINLFRIYDVNTDKNILHTCKSILSIFDIKHTVLRLNNSINNHLDAKSLLAIKDILAEYGVKSAAVHKAHFPYVVFETPFVCAIQQEDWPEPAFTVVNSCQGNRINYLNPLTNSFQEISFEEFEKMETEIVLLLDDSNKKDEINYSENKRTERAEHIVSQIPVYAFGLFVFLSLILQLRSITATNWISPLFLITASVGLIISLLLVWYDADAQNPFIKEVCRSSKTNHINCNAVLNSKGSKFLGINWSIWGSAYFATFFICQIIFSSEKIYLEFWSLISLATLVYVLYAVYYQAKMVKQWCPPCLAVQALIVINAILAMLFIYPHYSTLTIRMQPIFNIFFFGVSTLLLIYYSVPLLKTVREVTNYKERWRKLRFNPDIFQSLLQKSTVVTECAGDLGIIIGNPNARNEIIKVCNPYCGPCSKAHRELEQIIRNNNDVKVRIIFTASGDEKDIKNAPVQHLLAIEEKYGATKIHTALDDWYLADKKDYEAFAIKYQMNGELKLQGGKITAMHEWCEAMKIRATPTLYINGHELPDGYQVQELKNFF